MARERGKARRVSPDRRKRAERSPAATQTPEEESKQPQHSASVERPPASDREVEPPGQAQRQEQIAVAAYYHAERRGFAGNRELDDWLEAEREIDSRTAGAGIQHVASVLAEASRGAAAPTTDEDRKTPPGEELIEPDQLSVWAKKLKVPAPRLREAIQRVGPIVGDVKQYLEPSDDHA